MRRQVELHEQRAATTLAPTGASAREARQFVRVTLDSWHVPSEPIDTACLLATELVTNAVLHAGGEVELALLGWNRSVRVEVFDGSPILPRQRRADAPLSTSGRGMALVKALARTWGVSPRTPGKSVWFELSTD